MRKTSDLNLNARTPLRAQPGSGIWGPAAVPSTRVKKWQRVMVPLLAVLIAVGVFFLARMFYLALMGTMALHFS